MDVVIEHASPRAQDHFSRWPLYQAVNRRHHLAPSAGVTRPLWRLLKSWAAGGCVNADTFWEPTKTALARSYEDLVHFAIGAVEAIVVLAVATLIGQFLRRRVKNALERAKLDPNITALAANGAATGTYIVAITLVLAVLGANWTALLTVLGAGTVAISLALQDVLRSFVAGIYLLVERPFAIGDRIRVRDVEGTVEGIDIRTTALRTVAGERALLPNATVFAEILTNRSAAGMPRTTIAVKGLETPLSDVAEAIADALDGVQGIERRETRVQVIGAGEEGADIEITLVDPEGGALSTTVIARLRDRFPRATVSLQRD